jgi:hypothetical protein
MKERKNGNRHSLMCIAILRTLLVSNWSRRKKNYETGLISVLARRHKSEVHTWLFASFIETCSGLSRILMYAKQNKEQKSISLCCD